MGSRVNGSQVGLLIHDNPLSALQISRSKVISFKLPSRHRQTHIGPTALPGPLKWSVIKNNNKASTTQAENWNDDNIIIRMTYMTASALLARGEIWEQWEMKHIYASPPFTRLSWLPTHSLQAISMRRLTACFTSRTTQRLCYFTEPVNTLVTPSSERIIDVSHAASRRPMDTGCRM